MVIILKKQNSIIIFLLIILLFSFMKIGNISTKIDKLESEIYEISNEVMDIQLKLNEEEESKKLINSVDFEIKSIDNKEFISSMEIILELNRLPQNSEPVFAYREEDTDTWSEVALTKDSGLLYTGNIKLDQEKYYQYKVYTKGETQESSDIYLIEEENYTGVLNNWSSEGISNGGYLISIDSPYSKDLTKAEDFIAKDIYVEVESENETKRYELIKSPESDLYSIEIKEKNLPKVKYKIYLVAKYNNGLIKKHQIN